jgi:hypothetical protein
MSGTYSKPLGVLRNHQIAKELATLDPQRDHVRMVHLLTGYEFPWDMVRALEVALMRTFASPRISALLARTGEFHQRGQKRYDDTAVIVAEFMQKGYDSPDGQRAIAQMNHIHGHFEIANEDYLYVLSTFVLDPIRWLDKYGWRKLTRSERDALFEFFRQVGLRMNLRDLPATLAELEQYASDYQAEHFRYEATNAHVAGATVRIMAGWYPKMFTPLVEAAVPALIDADMRRAFGYADPAPWLQTLLNGVLGLRAWLIKTFNFEPSPRTLANSLIRTYRHGYVIEELGPERIIKKAKK